MAPQLNDSLGAESPINEPMPPATFGLAELSGDISSGDLAASERQSLPVTTDASSLQPRQPQQQRRRRKRSPWRPDKANRVNADNKSSAASVDTHSHASYTHHHPTGAGGELAVQGELAAGLTDGGDSASAAGSHRSNGKRTLYDPELSARYGTGRKRRKRKQKQDPFGEMDNLSLCCFILDHPTGLRQTSGSAPPSRTRKPHHITPLVTSERGTVAWSTPRVEKGETPTPRPPSAPPENENPRSRPRSSELASKPVSTVDVGCMTRPLKKEFGSMFAPQQASLGIETDHTEMFHYSTNTSHDLLEDWDWQKERDERMKRLGVQEDENRKYNSAIKIQARYRGHRARRGPLGARSGLERPTEPQMVHERTTHKTGDLYHTRYIADSQLQQVSARCSLGYEPSRERRRQSATVIQSNWRGYHTRATLEREKAIARERVAAEAASRDRITRFGKVYSQSHVRMRFIFDLPLQRRDASKPRLATPPVAIEEEEEEEEEEEIYQVRYVGQTPIQVTTITKWYTPAKHAPRADEEPGSLAYSGVRHVKATVKPHAAEEPEPSEDQPAVENPYAGILPSPSDSPKTPVHTRAKKEVIIRQLPEKHLSIGAGEGIEPQGSGGLEPERPNSARSHTSALSASAPSGEVRSRARRASVIRAAQPMSASKDKASPNFSSARTASPAPSEPEQVHPSGGGGFSFGVSEEASAEEPPPAERPHQPHQPQEPPRPLVPGPIRVEVMNGSGLPVFKNLHPYVAGKIGDGGFRSTNAVPPVAEPEWNENLEFDLPEDEGASQLDLMVCSRSRSGKSAILGQGWVDFGKLKEGARAEVDVALRRRDPKSGGFVPLPNGDDAKLRVALTRTLVPSQPRSISRGSNRMDVEGEGTTV